MYNILPKVFPHRETTTFASIAPLGTNVAGLWLREYSGIPLYTMRCDPDELSGRLFLIPSEWMSWPDQYLHIVVNDVTKRLRDNVQGKAYKFVEIRPFWDGVAYDKTPAIKSYFDGDFDYLYDKEKDLFRGNDLCILIGRSGDSKEDTLVGDCELTVNIAMKG